MIAIHETFTTVTHESAEHGDFADCGSIGTHAMTFRELVEALRGGEASAWPATGDVHEWVSQDQGETRAYFERGERETRSFHFDRSNPERKARYWRLAFIAAGLIKPQGGASC